MALFLLAGLTASAAPRFPFWAPAFAAAAPGAATRVGQAGQLPDDQPVDAPDDEDDEDDDIPVFEDDPQPAPVDSTSVPGSSTGARPDSAAMLPVTPQSAEPETLRYVPPGERPPASATGAKRASDEPLPPVKKPKQGIFGIPPIFLILGLTAAHVFVVKAVTD
ncbi:MAG TPA: hypothetical protein VJW75_09595 [Candidatus Eisenbacteria bacterium]|nr:hypothetical protein [Candidatus Eisenbacteria bacterium]